MIQGLRKVALQRLRKPILPAQAASPFLRNNLILPGAIRGFRARRQHPIFVLALFACLPARSDVGLAQISRFQGVPHGKVVMMRQFLVLVGVIAVVICSLLLSMYVLDFMKFPELREHLTKLLSILGIATAAGLIIMLLVRAAEKK